MSRPTFLEMLFEGIMYEDIDDDELEDELPIELSTEELDEATA